MQKAERHVIVAERQQRSVWIYCPRTRLHGVRASSLQLIRSKWRPLRPPATDERVYKLTDA